MEKFLKISEFAKEIGIKPRTLLKWDKDNILKPHHRTPGGHRVYTAKQVEEYFEKCSVTQDKK